MSIEETKKIMSISVAKDYTRVSLTCEDVKEMLARIAELEAELDSYLRDK